MNGRTPVRTLRTCVGLLRSRIGLGVQRARHPQAQRDLDRAGAAGLDAAWVRARVFAGLRQRRQSLQTAGTLESAPPTLDDYPIILRGSKGTDHRADAGGVVRSRVPRGLARHLPAGRPGGRSMSLTAEVLDSADIRRLAV